MHCAASRYSQASGHSPMDRAKTRNTRSFSASHSSVMGISFCSDTSQTCINHRAFLRHHFRRWHSHACTHVHTTAFISTFTPSSFWKASLVLDSLEAAAEHCTLGGEPLCCCILNGWAGVKERAWEAILAGDANGCSCLAAPATARLTAPADRRQGCTWCDVVDRKVACIVPITSPKTLARIFLYAGRHFPESSISLNARGRRCAAQSQLLLELFRGLRRKEAFPRRRVCAD